ncbi:hypothetical protein [Pseudoxanthomonas mexicana]
MKLIYETTTSTRDLAIVEMAGQGMNHRDRRTLVCIETQKGMLAQVNWRSLRRLSSIPGCLVINRTQVLARVSKFNDPAVAFAKVRSSLDELAAQLHQQEQVIALEGGAHA